MKPYVTKFFSLLFAVVLCASLFTSNIQTVQAASGIMQTEEPVETEETPFSLEEELIPPEESPLPLESDSAEMEEIPLSFDEDPEDPGIELEETSEVTYYDSIEQAAAAFRRALVNRQTRITIGLKTDTLTDGSDFSAAYSTALMHTGKGNEGDYLDHNITSYKTVATSAESSPRADGKYYSYATFEFTYLTTAQEESQVTSEIARILNSTSSLNYSKEQRLFLLYEYIVDHIRNTENVSSQSTHSAYAALINKEAACQGYALALYRLLLDAGYDTRYISGEGYDGSHAWNIVELSGRYYCLDATWDAYYHPGGNYEFYLKGRTNFDAANHTWKAPFTGYAFTSTYPMSDTDFVLSDTQNTKGICGDNLTWRLTADNTLLIEGTGRMYDFYWDPVNASDHHRMPWYALRSSIQAVTIGDQVTYVGNGAFAGLTNIKYNIAVGNSVTEIAANAFYGSSFNKMELPSSLTSIGSKAIAQTGYQSSVNPQIAFTGALPAIASDAFQSSHLTCLYPSADTSWNTVASQPASYQYGGAEITWSPSGGSGDELSGDYGDLHWSFHYATGTLTVSGNGRMQVKALESGYPWHSVRSLIKRIRLGRSVITVSANAFSNCTELEEVEIESGSVLSSIGGNAFKGCSALKNFAFPSGVTEIGSKAFADCKGFFGISFDGNLPEIAEDAFSSAARMDGDYPWWEEGWLDVMQHPDRHQYGTIIDWEYTQTYFVLGRDNNSFSHALSNLPERYSLTLAKKALGNDIIGYCAALATTVVTDCMNGGGVCYGASSLMSLMQRGYFRSYFGKDNFYAFNNPKNEASGFWDVLSFYQLVLQVCGIYDTVKGISPDASMSSTFGKNAAKEKEFLQKLVNEAKYAGEQKKTFVIKYSHGIGGHGVLCTGYLKETASDGNTYHILQIYDLNDNSNFQYLYVTEDYSSFLYVDPMNHNIGSNWTALSYYGVEKMEKFINAFPEYVARSQVQPSEYPTEDSDVMLNAVSDDDPDSVVLMISGNKRFHLKNDNGAYLSSDGNQITGTMEVLDHDFFGGDELMLLIRVYASDIFELTGFEDGFRFMTQVGAHGYYAKTSGASKVTISKESGLHIEGSAFSFESGVTTDFAEKNILLINGTAKEEVFIESKADGVLYQSEDSSDVTIRTNDFGEETDIPMDPDTDRFTIKESPDSGLIAEGAETSVTPRSGTLSDSISWSLASDGTMTISGTGDMPGYKINQVNDDPLLPDVRQWAGFREDIRHLIIEDGVTNIGSYTFYNCTNLKDVSAADSVTTIGRGAFSSCTGLSDAILRKGLKLIDAFAFMDTRIRTITLPGTLTQIGRNAFALTPIEALYFKGKAPTLDDDLFGECASFSIYVPQGDSSWTSSIKEKTYGCSGTITWKTWTIPTSKLSACTMTFDQKSYKAKHDYYEGSDGDSYLVMEAVNPIPKIMDGDTLLKNGLDYYLTYKDNYRPGTATVTAVGRGEYEGTLTGTFTIVPRSIKGALIEEIPDCVFTGNDHGRGKLGELSVKLGELPLSRVLDYEIDYKDGRNAGTVTVTLTGVRHNGWKDSIQYSYRILPEKLSSCTITLGADTYAYTGEPVKPNVIVKLGYTTLEKDTDYKLTYKNSYETGTGTVTVSPGSKGNLTGASRTLQYKISEVPAGDFNAKLSTTRYTYNGKLRKPSVTVTCKGKKLSSKYYTVTYSNNKKVGKAVVLVKGKGIFKNLRKVITFDIAPKATSFTSAKSPGKRIISLKWKKISGVSGYQIYYSTNKNFKNSKKKTVANISSCKLTSLLSKKSYYVKIRPYYKVPAFTKYGTRISGKVFGSFSKVKKVTVK